MIKLQAAALFLCIANTAFAIHWEPFQLSQVRLTNGIFKDSAETNFRVLDEIGPERALHAFRVNAKLPTKASDALQGWGSPEPSGAFPGCYESHYLSAISLAYAQTGEKKWLDQVNYIVAELAKCQTALGGKFLFASPEIEFAPDRLDGVAWYRMHKLLEGLIAAQRYAGNQQALEILKPLADWITQRIDSYGNEFDKVKKTEFGGMTEALENLYQMTHKPKHREIARQWEQRTKILDRYYDHEDYNEHANTLVAKMVGAARIAEVENSTYHTIATENFWDLVCGSGRKTYATGGTSIHEGMPPVGMLADSQSKMPQETCVSYNLLKITDSLFHLDGDPKYMDYYERSLFNSILGSQDPITGWKTYYQPLSANTVKDFRSPLTGCFCCNGTGLENPGRYGTEIYSHNDSALRINLFVASVLDWKEKGIQLTQNTCFPMEGETHLTLDMKSPVETEISIRVPGWCASGIKICLNGAPIPSTSKPGSYLSIQRLWKSGDRIDLSLKMTFSKYRMPGNASQMAFLYGPIVMVGEGARPSLSELVGEPKNLQTWFKPVPNQPLHFMATDDAGRSITFKPYYEVGENEFFTGYWDIVNLATTLSETNFALGKPTTCSTPNPIGVNVEDFMRSAKAVDGQYGQKDDFYTKWFPNGISPQWIAVDLGAAHTITRTEWFPALEDFEKKIAYRYRIDCSRDGKSWENYDDQSENSEFHKSYRRVKPVIARYFRLTTLPNSKLQGNDARPKVAEFEVFGNP